jgi:SAM-dependent methyltransferase
VATFTPTPALDTFEAFAATYDVFTHDYDHELWLSRILELARAQGLRGRRALDVACGTGKSAVPLLARGFDVVGCDLSESMVTRARERLGDGVELHLADMRDLPADLGEFDLVTCLDDALNYLHDEADLIAAFAAVRGLLDDDGVYVFDVNTLLAYEVAYARDMIDEIDGTLFCWHGEADSATEGDVHYRARLDAFHRDVRGDDYTRTTIHHVQRHFSDETVRDCLDAAGLRCLDLVGQASGVRLSRPADEAAHHKRLYVAGIA